VEDNDCIKNDAVGSSPVIYRGSITHGIFHVIDSTSKQPTLHIWLGNIELWPMAANHFRAKNYDTFLFTPYSSRDNWIKMNPEMKVVASIVSKEQGSSTESAANKLSATKKSNDDDKGIIGDFIDVIFGGSYLSIIIKMSLLAFVVGVAAVLAHKMNMKTGELQCAGLFGGDQHQCIADNNEMGLREKTALLFGQKKKSIEEHAQALITWLEKEGGYFHPKLEMRRVDPSDPNSYFGMFANEFIPKEELLMRVPRSMVLGSAMDKFDGDTMTCETVRNLIDQFKLKDDSKYAPYVNYLLDTQPPGSPSAWSEAGKALFTRVLSPSGPRDWVDEWVPPEWSEVAKDFLTLVTGEPDEIIDLPPSAPFSWLDVWHESCKGSTDPLEEYAALIVIQRSWDEILIPVLDMMSHGNGRLLNTVHSDIHDPDEDIELTAKRDIKANEQIYTSYNQCESCGGRKYEYDTGNILREYGFVEQMPQSFYFEDMKFGFRVDENWKESGKGKGYGKPSVTNWVYKKPSDKDVEQMKQMLEQIKRTKAKELIVNYGKVNDYEWETINNYINALENGLRAAVRGADMRRGDEMMKGSKIEVIGTEELIGRKLDSDDSSDDSDDQ